MASHQHAKFGGHRHCGSGDMVLAVEEQDYTRPRFDPPLLFISKATWHVMPTHMNFLNVGTIIC